MPTEQHKLQKDPPEGSRETIERELKRNEAEGAPDDEEKKPARDDRKQ